MRSGWLNVVPSQHCTPEALKHFGDKHYLAVKRATEEKAYQMCSQWAVSCIIRHELQIRCRLKFDAQQQSSVPAALPCVQAPAQTAARISAGGVFSSSNPPQSYPIPQ